jgi:hypothetical protein
MSTPTPDDTPLLDVAAFRCALDAARSPVPIFKKTIRDAQERMHQRFRDGEDIRKLIYGRAWVIDQVLCAAWNLFEWPDDQHIALVAVGGYGRGELHPHSDVDILILLNGIEAVSAQDSIRVAALARLAAFSELFLDAPDAHPHEFRLQQQLLVTRDGEEMEDAATIVPAAMAVLDVPRRLLADATALGALDAPAPTTDPLGQPLDGALVRTLAWVVALNGALLTDNLATGLPATGAAIGRQLTASLLRGWGADADELDEAITVAAALTTTD